MLTVTFLRKDAKPAEIYCYQREEDARYHFELFRNDDSGLYQCILLEDNSSIIDRIC